MIKHTLLVACTFAALTGLATAQGTSEAPGAAGASNAGSQGNSTSAQTVPGWGGTQAPRSSQGGTASGQTGTSSQATQPGQGTTQTGQTGSSGLITVNPTTVLVTYYSAQPADTLASKLMKATVYNNEGQRIGDIEDLLIDQGRNIGAVIIGVGGFLGLGERYISLPPSSVVLTPQANGSYRAVINATQDSVRTAPEFKFQGNQSR